MLYQPQGAINGMLTRRIDGERQFLFQARAEPGNVGEVQFGPTLQSTPANYLQFHGGRTSDFFPHFLQQSWDTSLALRDHAARPRLALPAEDQAGDHRRGGGRGAGGPVLLSG